MVKSLTQEEYVRHSFCVTLQLLQYMSAKAEGSTEAEAPTSHPDDSSKFPAWQEVVILTDIAILPCKIFFAITHCFPAEGNHFTFSTVHARVMNTSCKQKPKIKPKAQSTEENPSILTCFSTPSLCICILRKFFLFYSSQTHTWYRK